MVAAVVPVGLAYGATSAGAGLPPWFAPCLGVLVLAGSAELLFVGALSVGTGPWLAVLSGLAVNARHLPYGLAGAHLVGTGPGRWLRAHLLNDETLVLGLAQPTPAAGRRVFVGAGLGILAAWPLSAALGVALGAVVPVRDIGLDAVFPAVIAALAMPALRTAATRQAALLGGVTALCCAPLLPPGLPTLAALVALAVPTPRPRRAARG